MGEQELLARFQELAIEHLRASEQGDADAANSCVDEIGLIVRQLWRENGSRKEALRGLAKLAKSTNPAVAMKAVTYTIELYPEVADELPRLKKEKSMVGPWAKYALRNWKGGQTRLLKDMLRL